MPIEARVFRLPIWRIRRGSTSLIRDGKIYLSLQNAIDLALEDNLDMVISRYNLPIAQTDILRTAAGGQALGVNTGVVSGTPGGTSGGLGGGSGAGAGGTSGGAGGAGAGASGLVQSTLGTGTSVSNYDPLIQVTTYVDHTTQQLPNTVVYGIPVIHLNTILANVSYSQAFPTGGSIQAVFNNNRETTNSPNNSFNPQLTSFSEFYAQQPLLAGFGFGPNLRFLRIARTNQKVSDIAFRAQVIATVTQICNIYWDLVNAYEIEQVSERSVSFANETLDKSRKQLQLQAIPEMDVLKAEGDVATREQDLTVARTNLQLQELYMKNAITRTLDDPILEEMPVIPTDHVSTASVPTNESVQELIEAALKNRTEVQENALTLKISELTRKTARNALLPSLSIYGYIDGTGYGGVTNPASTVPESQAVPAPTGYGTALTTMPLSYTSPEYQVGFQLSLSDCAISALPKPTQYRTENLSTSKGAGVPGRASRRHPDRSAQRPQRRLSKGASPWRRGPQGARAMAASARWILCRRSRSWGLVRISRHSRPSMILPWLIPRWSRPKPHTRRRVLK